MATSRSLFRFGSRPRSAPSAQRWAAIRLFAMDVDGVLTDGSIYVSSDGAEMKRFSVLDGMGLSRLRQAGRAVAWISGRESGATTRRATELKIPHLIQGRTDKLAALQELAARLGLSPEAICYMGDDDIDTPAISWAGIGANPQYDQLMEAVALVKRERIDFLLAVGGGSVVDGTKFVAAAASFRSRSAVTRANSARCSSSAVASRPSRVLISAAVKLSILCV